MPEIIGNATLYLGDCKKILQREDITADIVVTSPPYNQLTSIAKGGYKEAGTVKWQRKVARSAYADDMPEEKYQKWLVQILELCRKRTKGLVWVNHKVRYRNGHGIHPMRMLPWPIQQEVIWDRGGGTAHGHSRFVLSHEAFYAFGKPHYWNPMADGKMSVWRIHPEKNDPHPCPFPLALVTPIILASCPIGGTTLDPFMGRGTVGAACLPHNRKFIGIEKEQKHFTRACKWMEKIIREKLKGGELQDGVYEFLESGPKRYSELQKHFNIFSGSLYHATQALIRAKLIKKTAQGVYKRK